MLICVYEKKEVMKNGLVNNSPKTPHICEKQLLEKYDYPVIAYGGMWDTSTKNWTERFWVLDSNSGNDIDGLCVEIFYCPFCGDKLKSVESSETAHEADST